MRNLYHSVLAAIVLMLGCSGPALAFDSLLAAWRSALRSDRIYLAAEAQQRSVQEKLPQARAGLLPSITANANRVNNSAQVDYEGASFANTDRQFVTRSWTLSLSQPLFRMSNFLQYGRAQLQVEQSAIQLEASRYDLMLRMTKALLDWQTALRTKEATELAKHYAEAAAAQARSRRALQRLTVPDLLDVEARLKKAEADALDAAGDLKVKAAALAKVLGVTAAPALFAFKPLPWPEIQGAVEQWVAQAQERNPMVRYAALQVAMADKDVNTARSAHLPNVNLVMNKMYAYNSGGLALVEGAVPSTTNQTSIGIQLDMPIFSGGATNSRVAEMIALRDKANEDLENARGNAAVDTQANYFKAQAGLAQIQAAEMKVRAAEEELQGVKAGMSVKTKLELDALGAEMQLLAAKRDYFRAQADTMVSVLQLRQVSGELSDADLEVWSSMFLLEARLAPN